MTSTRQSTSYPLPASMSQQRRDAKYEKREAEDVQPRLGADRGGAARGATAPGRGDPLSSGPRTPHGSCRNYLGVRESYFRTSLCRGISRLHGHASR